MTAPGPDLSVAARAGGSGSGRILPLLLLLLPCLAACGGDRQATSNAANTASGVIDAAPIVDGANVTNATHAVAPTVAPPPAPASPSRSVAAPAKQDMADYRAIGTEPFWAVTIRGHSATFERPDHPPVEVAVVRVDNGGAVSWSGEGLTLRVSPGPCSDGMSDAVWSDRVQVAVASGTLKGCGGHRDDPEAGR